MSNRVRRAWFLALLCCLLAQPSCSGGGSSARGALLVIAIDELRAEHLSLLGYDRETTPRLAAFAREAVVFERAFAAAPWVVPAHLALLTGCDAGVSARYLPPNAPGGAALRWRLPRSAPSLAEEMLRAGYSTAAFVEHPLVGPALGFSRGFQTFDTFEARHGGAADGSGALGRLEKWIAQRASGAPWFAYVELAALERSWARADPQWDRRFEPREELAFAPPVADAHFAYFALPRRRWSGAFATFGEYEARYDGALARLDLELGHFFERLYSRPDSAELTVAIVGAFGLSLGEGGLYVDSGGLGEGDLRAPWLVRLARRFDAAPRGVRIGSVASAIDLAPTLLELCGAPVPPAMQGRSWCAQLTDPSAPPAQAGRAVFARFGRQAGFLAARDDLTFSHARPWESDPVYLTRSWYGGPPPAQPAPLEELRLNSAQGWSVARELDRAARARVDELHAQAQAWFARVEEARRAFSPAEYEAFGR